MYKKNIISLLTKPVFDEEVIELLSYMKKDPRKIKLPRLETSVIVDNEKEGIQLTFAPLETFQMGLEDPDIELTGILTKYLNLMETESKETLFLSDIDLDYRKNKPVEELLPDGLKFNLTKEEIYSILGIPTLGENDEFNTAGWIFDYYKYAARFSDDNTLFSFGANFMEHSHLMEF